MNMHSFPNANDRVTLERYVVRLNRESEQWPMKRAACLTSAFALAVIGALCLYLFVEHNVPLRSPSSTPELDFMIYCLSRQLATTAIIAGSTAFTFAIGLSVYAATQWNIGLEKHALAKLIEWQMNQAFPVDGVK